MGVELTKGERTRRQKKDRRDQWFPTSVTKWMKGAWRETKLSLIRITKHEKSKQTDRLKYVLFLTLPLFCYLLVVTWLENNSSSSPCTGQTHVDKRTHILTKTREKLPSPAATSVHTGIQTEPSSQQRPARETEKCQCAYRSSQERRKFFTSNSVTTGIIWAWIYCILLWRHHCCSEQEYLYSLFTF